MAEAIMAHPDLRHPFKQADVGSDDSATVIYNNQVFLVTPVDKEDGLWVSPEDLTRINGFVLKPEGACLGDLCVPVREGGGILKVADGKSQFNLAAFADLMEQSVVVDEQTRTWSLGEMPVKRQSMLTEGMAPEFEVLDREGNVVRMADYKGKKALIITWSSW